jgi:7,8-dihydro-6-hydroxymethylpterin dimethyltransferase
MAENNGYPYTISMCVTSFNVHEMPGIVDLAADMGASNVHYMWYFVRGRAKQSGVASVDALFEIGRIFDSRRKARHPGR